MSPRKKKGPIYTFRPGARINKELKAQDAGEALEVIREEHGTLVPMIVVSAARPKSHPLHAGFEWDDSLCGRLHREWQARQLIRSIRVVREEGGEPESAYVNVPRRVVAEGEEDQPQSYYQSTRVVLQNVDEYERALGAALEKLSAAKRAVEELEQLATGAKNAETLALLALALKALSTADGAVRGAVH